MLPDFQGQNSKAQSDLVYRGNWAQRRWDTEMEAAASKAATVEEAQKRKEKQTVEKRKLTAVDSSVDSTASPTGERSSKKPATATSAGAAASAAPAVASQLSLEDQVRAADTTATQAAVLLDAPGNWSVTPDVVAMVMGRKIPSPSPSRHRPAAAVPPAAGPQGQLN